MICSMLAALDSSPCGRSASRYAAYLAEKLGAAVEALTVIDIRPLEGPMLRDFTAHLGLEPFETYTQALRDVLQQRANDVLTSFMDDAAVRNLPDDRVSAPSEVGIVAETICRRSASADLVLIGQRGEYPAASGGLLGSTSEQIVRRACRPVLVCPEDFSPISHPLVAYDGSDLANGALHLAADFARQLGTGLSVLVVVDGEGVDERGATQVSDRAVEYLAHAGVETRVETVEGHPEEAIVERSAGHDLVVIGAFAHSRIRELFVGSVTAHVMRNSAAPVMLTR